MLTVTEVDSRPVSEYLYVYDKSRKANKYLHYCKNCIMNFDLKERSTLCPRCGTQSLVTIPGEPVFKNETFAERLMRHAKNYSGAGKKEQKAQLSGIVPNIALLRLRILFHYLTVSASPQRQLQLRF